MTLWYFPLYQLYPDQLLFVTYSTTKLSPAGSERCASVRLRHPSIAALNVASSRSFGIVNRDRNLSNRSLSDPCPGNRDSRSLRTASNSLSVCVGATAS